MTLEEFEIMLAAHGARRERWPADRAREADALCASSVEAARMLREAATLDGLLSAYAVSGPDAALRARILAAASDDDGARNVMPLPGPRRKVAIDRYLLTEAAALMAATFIGVWIGINVVTLPLLNEEDYSSYVLGDNGDVVASYMGEGQ